MTMQEENALRKSLEASDSEFRGLSRAHARYEARLSELSALRFPSDEEQLEEATLKKKKLAVKDQMRAVLLKRGVAEAASA